MSIAIARGWQSAGLPPTYRAMAILPPTDAPRAAPVPPIVWITGALLAAFVFALEVFGMWIAAFGLMVGLGRLWGEKRLARLAVASAVMLFVIWYVFVRLLKGGFPEGMIARLWS